MIAQIDNLKIRSLIQIAIFLFIAGCATQSSVSLKTFLVSENFNSNGWVSVTGYIRADIEKRLYLYVNEDAARHKNHELSLDIIAEGKNALSFKESITPDRWQCDDENVCAEVLTIPGEIKCVEVYGKFEKYGENALPIGYLQSPTGLIDAQRISVSDNCMQ